ncbi:MAG: hypothetical protein AAGA48_34875 [Myxococcota bacterium]
MRHWTILAAALGVACTGETEEDPVVPEAEEAWLIGVRVRTPDSRSVFAVVVEDPAEAQTIDLSGAIEFSGASRLFAVDGYIYAMDSESGVVNRLEVGSDSTVRTLDTFSMQGEGVTSFRSTFAFVSPERAYYIDVVNDQIIVWNPTTMALIESVPFEAPDQGGLGLAGGTPVVTGDQVIMPVSWSNLTTLDFYPAVAAMLVSTTDPISVTFIEDARCVSSGGGFVDDAGDYYLLGDSSGGAVELLEPDTAPPSCLLRIPSGETSFDPDFSITMSELTGRPYVNSIAGIGDGTAVVQVFDPSVSLEGLDPLEFVALSAWQWARIDTVAETAELVEREPARVGFGPFADDQAFYLPEFQNETGQSELVIWPHGDAEPSVGPNVTGEIQVVSRIR